MVGDGIAKRDFFISRTGADKDVALLIEEILRGAGYATFLQDNDFGHTSFMARMAEGFAKVDDGGAVVALVSRAYLASEYCLEEAQYPLIGDPQNKLQRLIVLRIDDCAPTGFLKPIPYVDISGLLHDRTALRAAVLDAVDPMRKTADAAAVSRRAVIQIIHPEVRAVPGFTARTDELAGIEAALWKGGGRAALTDIRDRPPPSNIQSGAAAIKGLGGVGKSVLAQQYAWDNRERYQGVWWVRAETRETLLDDLVALGIRFNDVIGAMKDREQAARIALEHIEQTAWEKPWLIVYDNAESPDKLATLTPKAGAHTLITTRWPDWYGHAREVAVGVFPAEVAVAYLLERAHRAEERPEAARKEAAALAEELGRLPLALAIARAHAASMGWDYAQYRKHFAAMLDKAPGKSVDYPRSVAATFALAIEKAAATSPEAEKLLAICAFLAPDRIPLDIITKDVMSEIEKGEAVAALAEVSLVTHERLDDGSPGISVHRLVQAVMRGRLAQLSSPDTGEGAPDGAVTGTSPSPPGERVGVRGHSSRVVPAEGPLTRPGVEGDTGTASPQGERLSAFAALATRLVAEAYPTGEIGPNDVRSWPACRRLEGHVVAVLEHAPETGTASDITASLLNQYAAHLWGRAEFAGAEPLMRRALAIDEASHGLEHPAVAIRLNNLARLLNDTGRLAEAEPLMRRALAIDEDRFGPEHPSVATDLSNLAALLEATNRLGEAEPLMRRALAIDEASFGPEHPNVAIRLNNLAGLLQDTSRLGEAEPLMRRALAIDEASLGPEHPNVGIGLGNLAGCLMALGRLQEAEPLRRRELRIMEAALPVGHPHIATASNNLAQLLQATNRLGEAEPLMRRALAIDEASLGPEHPAVARDLNNLAQLLQNTNRLEEAEPLMRRALEIFEKSLGAEHPSTRTVAENLAGLLAAMGAAQVVPAEPPLRPVTSEQPPRKRGWLSRLLGRG